MTIAPYIGIDVSYANSAVDWNVVSNDPQNIRFAYLKATEGTSIQDPTFKINRTGANAAGIPTGAYHFYSLTSPVSTQANNFIKMVGQVNTVDLPPVLDFEQNVTAANINQVIDGLQTWLTQVQTSLGVTPIIYTSFNYWQYILGNPTNFTAYKLWLAYYGSNNPQNPTSKSPNPLFGGWTEWAFWQYLSQGSVQGINGMVDLNRYNSDSGILQILT